MGDFEIANYADASIAFSAKLNHKSVLEELKISSAVLFTQLPNNLPSKYSFALDMLLLMDESKKS